ncbi:preprotein translocase subunit YajC [Zavarzinia compransoris]|uniref:preprotein translocase subunit YajC n=1 Tax=Zavarzinia compransoris TaxID=1264899 RepID=UPI0010F3BF70|nr:preprotein translocase subunit YajC [Zavarzinia compransoris]TDP47890.1 protein translocase subunit yajC [Zavarzinia compransoris]
MLISTAYAQAAGAAPGGSDLLIQFLPLVLILVVFYFLMIRPQQKRAKEHRALLSAVRRGDTVVTMSGLIGKVAKVQDNEILLEIAEGVRVRILKSTISEVRTKGQPVADDEK